MTTTRVVSPTGGTSGTGTDLVPWSFDYALINASIGDTLQLDDGTYENEIGYGSTITNLKIQPRDGAVAILDGAMATYKVAGNSGWELYDAATNTYRTVSSSHGPSGGKVFGHIQLDGQWYPLATHKTLAALMATETDFVSSGTYFMGPGIYEAISGGRVYVRLMNADLTKLYGIVPPQVTDYDPGHHDLRICKQSSGLATGDIEGIVATGDGTELRGLVINDYYTLLNISCADPVVQGCSGRFGFFGINLQSSTNVDVYENDIDGLLDPATYWVAWSDVKGGAVTADWTRKCAISGTAATGRIHDNRIAQVFDGILGDQFHEMECDNNVFDNVWDDGWQMAAYGYHINVHHNYCYGAAFSTYSPGAGVVNPYPGTVYIHHNVVDTTRQKILWGRPGRTSQNDGTAGIHAVIPWSAHGIPGAGQWTWERKIYQNTTVMDSDTIIGVFVGVGHFGAFTAAVTNVGSVHMVMNNIFIIGPGSKPLARDSVANTGTEIYDGNCYWGWQSPNTAGLFRLLHASTGVIDADSPVAHLNTIAKLHATQAFTDSKAYYTPGWEASGIEVNPALDENYRPTNTLCHSGAVDLTATGWPGTDAYEPFRGAIDPLTRSKYTIALSFA